MDSTQVDLNSLFKQLGLGDTDKEITAFVAQHYPLSSAISLANAEFWSESQAAFLRSAIDEDAEWAIIIGQLDSLMRHQDAAAPENRGVAVGDVLECTECRMSIKVLQPCRCLGDGPNFTCCGKVLQSAEVD